ncbi:isoprenylcysteine carboxylmethyltransferase family protein [Micromonospora sp. NPDC023737]|uniref:isoprenylcysteine carboxylmethyltransferase family protein n=1 Tax=unclassified Micromonospora TaxID=2617518 RepID=UPI0034032A26
MTAARYLSLGLPVLAVLAAARLERGRDARAAALLAFVACAVGVAALNEVARLAGWFSFAPVPGSFRGLPVDLWLGWAALWGALPVLLRRALPTPVALGLLLWLDALAMPELHPLVHLGPHWLVGEVLGLLVVALPAQLLGRLSADRRHLRTRVLLQLAVFTATLLWLVPTVAFELGDSSWGALTGLPAPLLLVVAQVGLLVAAPALAAVREFVLSGEGTPYPWDPPRRLVATGPYAYLANPMQFSAVALLLLVAAASRSATLAAAGAAAVAFGAAVARPHEEHDLDGRYGQRWRDYRREVRDWRPRRRPYATGAPAVLWLDVDCGPCAAVWQFLERRRPVNLTIAPASEHPRMLWRAEYTGDDGHTERGVAAVARALEHVDLGWAWLGWFLRVPGVTWAAQLVTDAMIAPPHSVDRRGEACPTPSNGCSTERSRQSAFTASPVSRPVPSPPPPE